jgi:hypothetical protein
VDAHRPIEAARLIPRRKRAAQQNMNAVPKPRLANGMRANTIPAISGLGDRFADRVTRLL